MIELINGNQTVNIDAGELVGFLINDHQLIHQKGSPGWRSSDTEMFPIIGPTNEADFRVQVSKGGAAVQDQHGLLRELTYELVSQTKQKAVFSKNYEALTRVENSKYPEKSTAPRLIWPFSFQFQKTFELKEDGLHITFSVNGEKGMPFMLGYHPAFKLHTTTPQIISDSKKIGLDQILEVGSRALEVPHCEHLILEDTYSLEIRTEEFGSFMLWTEVPNMVCIEPITFYPYAVSQGMLHEGFQYLDNGAKEFKVVISVK
ncbi:aldose 1-epimerase [Spongiimicrobium sp. 3-5]|uniref:aldose epimerase family protein n=1 Tax=Spongiimicrobium sp. 3-5 TaxID=3332596 RepID=UPI00397F955C